MGKGGTETLTKRMDKGWARGVGAARGALVRTIFGPRHPKTGETAAASAGAGAMEAEGGPGPRSRKAHSKR